MGSKHNPNLESSNLWKGEPDEVEKGRSHEAKWMARYQQDYLVLRKSLHGSVARSVFFFFNNQAPRAKCKELRK